MNSVRWLTMASIFLACAVAAGAFGAHALKNTLDVKMLEVWHTANFYHFVHGLGLLLVPMLATSGLLTESSANTICWLLAAGILIFSGSLYVLALTRVGLLGAITPVGGAAFIIAWLLLAFRLVQK